MKKLILTIMLMLCMGCIANAVPITPHNNAFHRPPHHRHYYPPRHYYYYNYPSYYSNPYHRYYYYNSYPYNSMGGSIMLQGKHGTIIIEGVR